GRIGQDGAVVVVRLVLVPGRTQRQCHPFARGPIGDVEVQVHLDRGGRIGPYRRLIPPCGLGGDLTVAPAGQRPVILPYEHGAAGEGRVEVGERGGVRAVDGRAAVPDARPVVRIDAAGQ